ncbi:MAG TPA: hypothetical protein ACQGQW_09670, partial [Xylella fastidiosa subsp. pauca]
RTDWRVNATRDACLRLDKEGMRAGMIHEERRPRSTGSGMNEWMRTACLLSRQRRLCRISDMKLAKVALAVI